MSFNPKEVRLGNEVRKQAKENPMLLATEGGSSFSEPSKQLDIGDKQRMAGPGGAFAMELMQNPELANRVAQFEQGYQQFQLKKMQLSAMGQPQKPEPKEKK
jgi:hypothetical protein